MMQQFQMRIPVNSRKIYPKIVSLRQMMEVEVR